MFRTGRHTYIVDKGSVLSWGTCSNSVVEVGSFTSIAKGLTCFVDGSHRMDFASTFPFKSRLKAKAPEVCYGRGPPVIGNDVWIGANVTVMDGVSIGHGAVVAANSVVSSSVPPYAVVAGNPARVKKMRFSPDLVERMQRSAWWELDDAFILGKLAPVQDDPEEWVRRVEAVRQERGLPTCVTDTTSAQRAVGTTLPCSCRTAQT